MLQKYKGRFWLAGLVVLLFFVASCGTGSATPPSQTLQNSIKAMSQLKSVHFNLQATLNLPSASASGGNSGGLAFNVTGRGDAVTPNQVALNLFLGQDPLLAVVSTGGKVYVQAKNGTWYVTDQSKIPDGVQKFFSQNLGQMISVLTEARLTDDGQETLNGETLDHITATLDAQTSQALSSQLNRLLPTAQQSDQNVLKQATVDLWIDQSTWYIHQAKLDLAANVDMGKLPKINVNGQDISLPASVMSVSLKAQLNLSNFNQPVTIQAPSGALPFMQH